MYCFEGVFWLGPCECDPDTLGTTTLLPEAYVTLDPGIAAEEGETDAGDELEDEDSVMLELLLTIDELELLETELVVADIDKELTASEVDELDELLADEDDEGLLVPVTRMAPCI